MFDLGLEDPSLVDLQLKNGYQQVAVNSTLEEDFAVPSGALKRIVLSGTEKRKVQSSNIISIVATTEKLFTSACQTLEVDIITIDMSKKLDFYLRLPNIQMAISRGIFFEITYGQALRDPNCRKILISNAHQLVKATKGKNIIISSSAKRELDLRAPLDAMAMASLFGMNVQQARDALTCNPKSVILHAYSRKVYKCAVLVMDEDKVENDRKRVGGNSKNLSTKKVKLHQK